MFCSFKKIVRPLLTIAALGLIMPIFAGNTPASAATRAGMPDSTGAPANSSLFNVQPDSNNYHYFTLNDAADPTFNQLLGIDNKGKIVGYFGSGLAGHPNKGYRLKFPYAQGNYSNENFPGSFQTQVVGLNNQHDTAGFWVDGAGNNFGFIEWNGVFTSYRNPKTGTGTVNQLLGINDLGIAVGFYTDGAGLNHGYALNHSSGRFFKIKPPGGNNVTAAGINDHNDVTGFLTLTNGVVVGYLLKDNRYYEFSFPKATATTPFGINNNDEIVGSYMDQAGKSHGFTLKNPLSSAHFHSIDDANGIGTTVVNGVNDGGDLVGFYVDAAGNTDGFLAKKF